MLSKKLPLIIVEVDMTKSPYDQPVPLHNRWHPDMPTVGTVTPEEIFRLECIDWTGGQICNTDCSKDVEFVDLTQVHYLSGPVQVEGAEPGDLLEVDLLDIGALRDSLWGFTGIFAR